MLTRQRDWYTETVIEQTSVADLAAPAERAVSSAARKVPLPRAELALVLGALAAFVWFNLSISLDLQAAWLGEVTVADPAVNL